jgi:hypothetical protein
MAGQLQSMSGWMVNDLFPLRAEALAHGVEALRAGAMSPLLADFHGMRQGFIPPKIL